MFCFLHYIYIYIYLLLKHYRETSLILLLNNTPSHSDSICGKNLPTGKSNIFSLAYRSFQTLVKIIEVGYVAKSVISIRFLRAQNLTWHLATVIRSARDIFYLCTGVQLTKIYTILYSL